MTQKRIGERDETRRIFYNEKEAKTFSGTMYAFYKTYGLDKGAVSRLVRGEAKTCKGWVYRGLDAQVKKPPAVEQVPPVAEAIQPGPRRSFVVRLWHKLTGK